MDRILTRTDPLVARTGVPQAASLATYNVNNQLTNWKGANLTYDANGNLTSDGTNTYTWNARNQLVSISGSVNASFQYDAFGRRVSKTIGGTTQFLYDGANPVQEISGSSASANLLTGGVDEYFQRTDSAGSRNFLTDALGSTLALADSTGTLQTSYTFEPFGNTTVSGSATSNSFAFTGRELDSTGLYFYRARYYNPQFQRFVSEDPIGLRVGSNLYAYVYDAPTNRRDSSGLCPVYVGHRPEVILSTDDPMEPSVALEHTFIVLGARKDKKGKITERTVLEGEPSGLMCPWFCHPKIDAEVYPLIPGIDPENPVWTDPEIFVADDGRSCSDDVQRLQKYANSVRAANVPYVLLGPNSNSVTNGGLSALGVNGWNPPILVPGWSAPIPH